MVLYLDRTGGKSFTGKSCNTFIPSFSVENCLRAVCCRRSGNWLENWESTAVRSAWRMMNYDQWA
jgi:hypothetical protein